MNKEDNQQWKLAAVEIGNRLNFYAPAILGHIVLPLSVLPSFQIQFSLIISVIHGHFAIDIGYIEFGLDGIILYRVMPLGPEKIPIIFSFRSLSP